jgi:hypothetical protein
MDLLDPHPTPKLEIHPLSAVHDYLFNTFAATSPYLQPEDMLWSGHRDPHNMYLEF